MSNFLAPGPSQFPLAAPARLEPACAAAVEQLLHEGESANTRASYRSAVRYWVAWWAGRYGLTFQPQEHLPVPEPAVMQFIVDHAARLDQDNQVLRHELPPALDRELVDKGFKRALGPLSASTLQHRLAALARLHAVHDHPSPLGRPNTARLMAAVRKAAAKRGDGPRGKDALDADRLHKLLATCDDSVRGRRDRAVLLFGFASGGRRRSEIAAADLAFLRQDGEGYVYRLVHSKTNQEGLERPQDYKPVQGLAAQALREWLRILDGAGIREGRIFRRVRKGGGIGESLSDRAIWEIVSYRCKLAGLEGDFGAHSLRSGFLTEAGRRKVALDEAMAFSGHKDVNTALGYMRRGSLKDSQAARMVDEAGSGQMGEQDSPTR